MKTVRSLLSSRRDLQFNMTPMIDIVFLLILFFMLTCKFIQQENYKLVVPDDCPTALIPDRQDPAAILVSVFPRPTSGPPSAHSTADLGTASKAVLYAVRSRIFDPQDQPYCKHPGRLFDDITDQIARQAQRKTQPLVHLRADKDITYGAIQNVLLALAQARIQTVQLAAVRSAKPPVADTKNTGQ